MLDFLIIASSITKNGVEIYPKFIVKQSSKDLMIRGGDFYAIWDEEDGIWSTSEDTAIRLIDNELDIFAKQNSSMYTDKVTVKHMWDADSGIIDKWHKYVQKQTRDHYHTLDEKLIFLDTKTTREDYASRRLPYNMKEGDYSAYNELVSTLYSPEERHKIEWAIGSILAGDSINIQKFLVMYGSAGTGKSTMLNIIQNLFEGYYCVFDAKALGSNSNSFALEAFNSNPLVAIQHDGDLSKIEDNTRLNSVVSHELMTVNEKFKKAYSNRFNCFLFMGTNRPVKITDSKSGIIRRLIDVSPSGNKVPPRRYKELISKISFELGAIAYHCRQVYLDNKYFYDDYIPIEMVGETNDFYNFVEWHYDQFSSEDCVTLQNAWEKYMEYNKLANNQHSMNRTSFKNELKNYFKDFYERKMIGDSRYRNYYEGFLRDKFEYIPKSIVEKEKIEKNLMKLECDKSIFDDILSDYPAQYADDTGTPKRKWTNVKTTLKDIDTSKIHYVKVPLNHIVIDFDIKDNGEKSLEKNLEAASKWPATYAELSKSGCGVHLHYIYDGDPTLLSNLYSENIEVKVFNGDSSLRRRLTKCNDIPIATLNGGLPLKKEKKMISYDRIKSENGLRKLIERNLNKEIMGSTKPSIDFIKKILDDAYESGLVYDISDMEPTIISFAMHSSNNAEYCLNVVSKMIFKSKEQIESIPDILTEDKPIAIFDCEVYPNLFVLCYKLLGDDNKVIGYLNPDRSEVTKVINSHRMVGFNCRKYDNHIVYGMICGDSNLDMFKRSQGIINNKNGAMIGNAYNLSYTDIYDFCSEKKSLKKWEIELGIDHVECSIPWDQEVPKERWNEVLSYCMNDVIATEAVWNARQADFIAREILADVAGLTVNDTTNTLTTKIIFGSNKTPQNKFEYRDMGMESDDDYTLVDYDEFTRFNKSEKPVFPGYSYKNGISTYRGEEIGEGGYVYSKPGMYGPTVTLDVASMHPSSVIAENLFGDEYTSRFNDILQARIAIKHKDFEKAKTMLGGKLAKYLDDTSKAKALSSALKIAINSVYGLTSAKFDNPFRDIRNKDNIVAKRGALFMVNLKHEVEKRGYEVVHIKTDSIKITNYDDDIIDFVTKYGKIYGYNFEIEHIFEKICLVNDAVYVAKLAVTDPEDPGKWTATGTQFKVPYVFKTLFSHEEIIFDDMCETKSVKGAIYLDLNENIDQKVEELKRLNSELKYYIKTGAGAGIESLEREIKEVEKSTHDYKFVGKVGRFCPVVDGAGGGYLTSIDGERVSFVTGTKGYRWIESEIVKNSDKLKEMIDISYYRKMVDDAVSTIMKFGDFYNFVD